MHKYWITYLIVLLSLFLFWPSFIIAAQDNDLDLFYGAEEMIETVSQMPKPITQVAENVSIITAEDIAAMPGVHTITDVLNRVPGIFIRSHGQDFANSDTVDIQGSNYKNVVFLIDGIRWNKVADGVTYTNSIPLMIVRRLEVIKGAASSVWGSALGGVINIITKEPGTSHKPTGTISASYGKYASQDHGLDTRGKIGKLGYYLYAGQQDSQGLLNNRYFSNHPLYGRLQYALPGQSILAMSMGYTAPDYIYGHTLDGDFRGRSIDRNFFYTTDLSVPLQTGMGFNIGLHHLSNDLMVNNTTISSGIMNTNYLYAQARTGGTARLTWQHDIHSAVLGGEYDHSSETDQNQINGYQAATIAEESWAIYLNDTVNWQKLSISPGLRYDYSSISDSILSPSLGLTYRLADTVLLRAIVAKGFRKPSLNLKHGDPLIYNVNPSTHLQPEKIWTYQAGIESNHAGFGSLKATLFRHESTDIPTWDSNSWQYVNGGGVQRQGVEIEARTVAVHDISLAGNYTYVYERPDTGITGRQYNAKLTISYDDQQGNNLELFGNYVWWGAINSPAYFMGRYNTFIWELSGRKTMLMNKGLDLEVFGVVHNLFNGSQYDDSWAPNAPRWLEVGMRLHY